jgi:hypothetical protein
MEVYHGIYLIFELALPTRNIMQLYIWWQYLRMRYMVDTTGNQKQGIFLLCCVVSLRIFLFARVGI